MPKGKSKKPVADKKKTKKPLASFPLLDLPDPLICQVLARASSFRHVLRTAATCSHLRQVVQSQPACWQQPIRIEYWPKRGIPCFCPYCCVVKLYDYDGQSIWPGGRDLDVFKWHEMLDFTLMCSHQLTFELNTDAPPHPVVEEWITEKLEAKRQPFKQARFLWNMVGEHKANEPATTLKTLLNKLDLRKLTIQVNRLNNVLGLPPSDRTPFHFNMYLYASDRLFILTVLDMFANAWKGLTKILELRFYALATPNLLFDVLRRWPMIREVQLRVHTKYLDNQMFDLTQHHHLQLVTLTFHDQPKCMSDMTDYLRQLMSACRRLNIVNVYFENLDTHVDAVRLSEIVFSFLSSRARGRGLENHGRLLVNACDRVVRDAAKKLGNIYVPSPVPVDEEFSRYAGRAPEERLNRYFRKFLKSLPAELHEALEMAGARIDGVYIDRKQVLLFVEQPAFDGLRTNLAFMACHEWKLDREALAIDVQMHVQHALTDQYRMERDLIPDGRIGLMYWMARAGMTPIVRR